MKKINKKLSAILCTAAMSATMLCGTALSSSAAYYNRNNITSQQQTYTFGYDSAQHKFAYWVAPVTNGVPNTGQSPLTIANNNNKYGTSNPTGYYITREEYKKGKSGK